MTEKTDFAALNDEELIRLSLQLISQMHDIKTILSYFSRYDENALTEELAELKAKAKAFEIELVKRSLAINLV